MPFDYDSSSKLITKGSNLCLFFHLSFLGVWGERIILCTLLTCVFYMLASRERKKDRSHGGSPGPRESASHSLSQRTRTVASDMQVLIPSSRATVISPSYRWGSWDSKVLLQVPHSIEERRASPRQKRNIVQVFYP